MPSSCMNTIKVVWSLLRNVSLTLEHFVVPISAGVIGWICADQLVLWVLEQVTPDSGLRLAFTNSAPLVYGARVVLAGSMFIIGWRYL